MIHGLPTPQYRTWTLILLVISGLSAIAAVALGIDDNPPGILLAFLAAIALVLAFVHPWRTSRQFSRLLYASILSFVIFGLLHNVFEAIASRSAGAGVVQALLNVAGGACFLIATLICPPGFLIGAVGAIITSIKNRRRPTSGPTMTA